MAQELPMNPFLRDLFFKLLYQHDLETRKRVFDNKLDPGSLTPAQLHQTGLLYGNGPFDAQMNDLLNRRLGVVRGWRTDDRNFYNTPNEQYFPGGQGRQPQRRPA